MGKPLSQYKGRVEKILLIKKKNVMKNNTLLYVKSNCNFGLNYESGKLHPQTEVIIITSAPKYELTKKKDAVTKELEISEYRFISDLDGINKLIGELQIVVNNITNFDQLAAGFNAMIESHKQRQEK